MSIFLFIWYCLVVVAGIFRAISFPVFVVNLMCLIILSFIFLG